MSTINITILGESNSGKTAFTKFLVTKKFEREHKPTLGVEIFPLSKFLIWDTAGLEEYGGIQIGYYLNSKHAIIFVDSSIKANLNIIRKYYRDFIKINPDAEIAIAISKVDIGIEKTINKYIDYALRKGYPYYLISSRLGVMGGLENILIYNFS